MRPGSERAAPPGRAPGPSRALNRAAATPTVSPMTVSCSRCGSPAASVMTFGYGDSAVWLDDFADPGAGEGYPMCADHADRMTPPLGWTLTDRRTVARLFAPVSAA